MSRTEQVEVLAGGVSHHGRVVRVGDTVRRPVGPWTPAVHALLRHLEQVGFEGAPRLLGADHEHEVLSYIPGEVAAGTPPPTWARTEALAASVARLLRRYHDAVRSFDFSAWTTWATFVPEAHRSGGLLGHNDTVRSNVVVRDGAAVALIDFDRAAPSSVVYELAVAVGQWIPLRGEEDDDPAASGLRTGRRLRSFLDAYGAAASERHEVLAVVAENEERNMVTLTGLVAAGSAPYAALVEGGAFERIGQRQAFLRRHRDVLQAALA